MTNDWNNADSLSQICLPAAVIEFASLYFIYLFKVYNHKNRHNRMYYEK